MNRQRLAPVLLLVAAILFFILAFSRPQQRGVWLALAIVFLVLGLARKRRGQP